MSRYAESHRQPRGEGDDRPTALEIVADEGLGGSLTGQVFLVTGVSSGIGVETMRALYATGGHVFGTVRNMKKGQVVVDMIKANTQGGQITLIEMDNESLASVKRAANEFLKRSKTLHVLINNAGSVNL
jgi:NAD(P)-dependent dehydrogenase (short-subunit alcohol dehydrogenase family)